MRIVFLLPILSLPVVWGCVNGTSSPEPAPTIGYQEPPQTKLKPPSELALLMREMAAFSDSAQARIRRGAELPPQPDFQAIHTATPTDGVLEMDRGTYTRFADHYLQQVGSLYAADPADRHRAFNATLSGCSNCHTVVCPGPMVKIKRMYVPLEQQ
jgi:hypothetical protein